jgi:tetratricopeptide (TPR) repeat protein
LALTADPEHFPALHPDQPAFRQKTRDKAAQPIYLPERRRISMKSLAIYLSGATVLLYLAPTALAAGFDDSVRAQFFAGFFGNGAALEKAMTAAEGVIAANSADTPEALAWHGGGLMLQSGVRFRAGDPAAAGELWARGLGEMEKAGQLAPKNPAVLIPRAAIWFGVSRQAPPDRARPLLEKAIADYELVYRIQESYFETLNNHMKSQLLFGLGDGYNRAGNPQKAKFYFEKLAALGNGVDHADQARKYLAGESYTVIGPGCSGCHDSK